MILSLLLNKKTNTNESKTQQPFFNNKFITWHTRPFSWIFFLTENFQKKSSMSWKLLFVKIIVVAFKTTFELNLSIKLY